MIIRKDPQILMMCTFFTAKPDTNPTSEATPLPELLPEPTDNFAEQVWFWSDMPSSSNKFETSDKEHLNQTPVPGCDMQSWLPGVPPCKQQRLDVSYKAQREQKHEQKMNELKKAHTEIEKVLMLKKTQFVAGANGLQAWWT